MTTKHKLKNIANRTMPVDGTDLTPGHGEVVEAEITPRLLYLIKNKFFEDFGPCPRKEEEPKKEEEIQTIDDNVEEPIESLTGIPGSEEDLPRMPVKSKKKKRKSKKKKKFKEMI